MVNYLYDPEQIEANHEAFVRGAIVRSSAVDALLGSDAGLAATATSQSETRKRRPRKR
jgi:malonyl-CoA decarboxylase